MNLADDRMASLPDVPWAQTLRAFGAGHVVHQPETWRAGVVFASPHSGNIYPQTLQEASPLSLPQLRRNEDMFIERLFAPVVEAGAPLLCAQFPRCYVDVNRAEDELLPAWIGSADKPTPRAAAGLGVVPTHISENVEIYNAPLAPEDVAARLALLYRPYHDRLQDMVAQATAQFGQALLIDCHSMPGFAPMGSRRPDIILGDRFGVSCHPDTLGLVKQLFTEAGYSVAINYPYAGGFVTTHYGRPASGIEALQIEINRDLYLNPVTLSAKRSYKKLAKDLREICSEVIAKAAPRQSLAAQ